MWQYIQGHLVELGTLIVSAIAVFLSIPALLQSGKANRASEEANRTSEQTLRHQVINDLFREYRQPDMAQSLRAMWNLNRERKEQPELVRVAYNFEARREYEAGREGELNAHRRRVTQFYVQLAVEATYDPLFRDVLYSLWFKRDLAIILPVDELILQGRTTMPAFAEMDARINGSSIFGTKLSWMENRQKNRSCAPTFRGHHLHGVGRVELGGWHKTISDHLHDSPHWIGDFLVLPRQRLMAS